MFYSSAINLKKSNTMENTATTATPGIGTRIQSIDLLRGLVMVLMAIDHVRVYSGLPAWGTEAEIFFTRWITHFCAPAFAFFAGTSAFLYGNKVDRTELVRYLVTRGLLLVILELTVIRFLWAFHINFSEFMLAGVIWMLGWCMILLVAFIRMKPIHIAILGVVLIVFQFVFGRVPYFFPESVRLAFGRFWEFVYPSGFETFPNTTVLYSIVPWIGVMAAGYGFGSVLQMEEAKRNRICRMIGLSMILLFLFIGTVAALSSSADEVPFIYRLLKQRKYPASSLFLLMTLGPFIAMVPLAEKAKGWISKILSVIGKVPFFYYLAHILVIHLSALLVQLVLHGSVHQEWFRYAPYVFIENEYRWSLLLLYPVFAANVVILYFLCRWYARIRPIIRRKDG